MDDLLDFTLPINYQSIIKVLGVGGGGSNAVNYMYNKGITGVDFIIANTDVQALAKSPVKKKIQLGRTLTEGLGAGNKPEKGREAAIENIEDVKEILSEGTKMVFITAGMGGGTGTGAAPVIAEAAKEMGILTVGIVTIPFRYEGRKRYNHAIEGINKMEKHVDALLIINNEKIREIYGDLPASKAFGKADEVLTVAAKGIAEIITVEGHVNVDFADVETVMRNSGVAIMGTGEGVGENRAETAVKEALNSPLLDNTDIRGAKNILVNIVSSPEHEATADEISFINEYVQEKAGYELNDFGADLIWGNSINNDAGEKLSVTIIATGFGTNDIPELYANKKIIKNEIKNPESGKEDRKKIIIGSEENFSENKKEILTENNIKETETDFYTEEKENAEIVIKKTEKSNIAETGQHTVKKSYEKNEVEKMLSDYTLYLDELERVPAYKRKGQTIGKENTEKDDGYSRETLSGNKNRIFIKENNPYLHDKAD